MTISKYIKSRGLTAALVAQEMGISRQAVAQYNGKRMPRADKMKRMAKAMTNLGAPTTAVDILAGLCADEDDTAEA